MDGSPGNQANSVLRRYRTPILASTFGLERRGGTREHGATHGYSVTELHDAIGCRKTGLLHSGHYALDGSFFMT